MPRYKLTIEYFGAPFVGWQRQDNGRSVQQALEEALSAYSGETVAANGAGRTDAGVHALAQVAHVDLARGDGPDTVRDAVNHHLRPEPISVVAAEIVDDEFDARFSAVRRHYLYRIVNRRAPLTIDDGRAWRVPGPLDAEAMGAAAQGLIGKHDFTTFRASECQAKSPIRTLERIDVSRDGDEIAFVLSAPSFLHNQVRSIVGTLERVGAGRWTAEEVKAALEARDRAACGPVAPSDGLYLARVDY